MAWKDYLWLWVPVLVLTMRAVKMIITDRILTIAGKHTEDFSHLQTAKIT